MKVVHFLGVQFVFPVWKAQGKCWFYAVESEGNRLESPVLSRFGSDFSRFQRDSADCGEIAGQSQINSNEIAIDSNLYTRRKHYGDAGRMCEVGPLASGLSFFTFPYSHLAVLNGNPALRGCFQA